MKRVLTILAILLLPLSVWAMTPVSDSDLSKVTGQAGVNINADLTMNISIGTMAWGDQTGIDAGLGAYGWDTTQNGAGYVGVTGFNITNLRVKARETDTFDGWNTGALKPITIDVATGTLYGGRTFVRFGLGSLEITMDAMDFAVEMGTTPSATGIGDELGVVSIGAMALYIDPTSYVDIYSHGASGVNFTFDIEIDEFDIGYVSWGDTDGLPLGNISSDATPWMAAAPAAGPGYIGIAALEIGGPITVTGTVAIDIVTTYAGIYAHGIYGTTPGAAPVTVVHISFPDQDFAMNVTGPITGDVNLSSVAALDGTGFTKTLGDIYISGFGFQILQDSWIDIWAH